MGGCVEPWNGGLLVNHCDVDWKRANCRGMDPNLFFPYRGEPTELAKSVCAGCVIRSDCLEYALAHEGRGIWGGVAERTRRKMRRGRPVETPGAYWSTRGITRVGGDVA